MLKKKVDEKKDVVKKICKTNGGKNPTEARRSSENALP